MSARTQGVGGEDYVLHRISKRDPLRTRCGRVAAKVNVTTDPTPREELCKPCTFVRSEDVLVGSRVVVKTNRGTGVHTIEGVVEQLSRSRVVLRVDGIPEAVSGVAGSEAWTTVGFRLFDIVEVKP